MRALGSATVVCRVLLGLDRAQGSGTLHLQGEGRAATLSFEESLVVGANVDRRVATSERQLLENLLQLCEWEGLVLRLVQDPPTATWWNLRQPVRGRELALRLIRAAARRCETGDVRAELGNETLRLTDAGEALISGGGLQPEETATVFWLRRGVCAEELLSLPGCGVRGYRFAWMLKLLGAAAPKAGGSYPLLLRKRRELRRRASARRLLDLPESADGGEARRALRKLVRDLHPDRFGESAPEALRQASGEIVSALVEAEARIASGASD